MPRNQRFPHARPQRRPHARFALLGVAAAFGALLLVPAIGPRGSVLDLQGGGAAPNAIAQGPTPEIVTPSPSPSPSPSPAASAATAPTATRAASTPPAQSATPAASVTAAPSDTPAPTPFPPAARAIGWAAAATRSSALGPSRLVDGPAPTPPPIASLTGYRWPVSRVRLTLPFGPTGMGTRVVGGKTFHDGIDLATFCGDRVMAAHTGVVLAAGRHYDAYMGWIGSFAPYLHLLDTKKLWMSLPIMVVTDDGNGYRSMYAHFGRIVVKRGQAVKAGQLLGYEGATGHATGCHVHYGLFSPLETATFAIRADVAKRMKLPKTEIARIDPLKILPPKAGVNAPKASPKVSPGPSSPPTP